MSINSEENMKKLLQTIYKPAVASAEFKQGLLNSLVDELSGGARRSAVSVWQQPKLWLSVITVLILAAIGYGIWLPLTFALP